MLKTCEDREVGNWSITWRQATSKLFTISRDRSNIHDLFCVPTTLDVP